MGLRILSTVGEALNFGGRRMETIARVAWLPLLLSMIATMTAAFAMLSVIAGQKITFAQVPALLTAQKLVAEHAARGFQNDAGAMWTITVASVVVQTLLTASFMAPLIRYAGLGEKPAPGFIRAPFGADQLRFVVSGIFGFLFVAVLVFGPMAAASFYTLKYITAAMAQTMASFPDPASLHTIEVKTAGELVAEQGRGWIYDRAMPLYGAIPLALIFWGLLFFHFHPDNRPVSQIKGNPFLRALVTLVAAAGFLMIGYFFLAEAVINEFKNYASKIGVLSSLGTYLSVNLDGVLQSLEFLAKSPVGRFMFFAVSIFFVVNYLSLRLFAYPGVAVCRRSLALGNTLSVTRGWNLLRLWVVVSLIGLLLYVMQVYVINGLLLQNLLPSTFNRLYAATAVATKLVNSGSTADWVLPFFVWVWNVIRILINVVWSFFSFGVAAGLYGRLYRESEAGH